MGIPVNILSGIMVTARARPDTLLVQKRGHPEAALKRADTGAMI